MSSELKAKSRNWVFLGDSLTEGIGSQRHSHVNDLVSQLRSGVANGNGPGEVHLMRMRRVDPNGFDRFIKFNLAGFSDIDQQRRASALWIWNLACEGQTIDTDILWLPFLANLRPEVIVLFRGSLESIVRPSMLKDSSWPWWVPKQWRSYSVMDPRCYFSSTWWRRAKQKTEDRLKQKARHLLLEQRPGLPLMNVSELISHYEDLLTKLRPLNSRIVILGLLPPDSRLFPGSPENFARVNTELKALSTRHAVEFFDWCREFMSNNKYDDVFYRDGFHPNPNGCRLLATELVAHLLKKN